ncbi:MAG: NAD(P)-binding domain-containing protein [Phycisphaerales bacterium]|nr:NAD(P)-binding domain-containing protein [Phycisphaerales bacterium]
MTFATDTARTASTSSIVKRVLIADTFEQVGLEQIEKLGCKVHVDPTLSGPSLETAIQEHQPDALIVRSTKVPASVFEVANNLGLVIRAGAGYDTIDVAAASALGIPVANCPGMNAIAVAELAWGLILSCDRRIPDQCEDLRQSKWDKKNYSKAEGLYGRTMGIVGLGRIGLEVAKRATGFGMNVVAWGRNLTEEQATAQGVGWCRDLMNLVQMSDVISIHVSATPETRHLVNSEFCEAMKPGAILINTTRGSVVDEQAVADAVQSKGIRAGLDVFENEPGSGETQFKGPIVHQQGVYGTHHVGASTNQAQSAIASEAVRVLKTWLSSGTVPNCINTASSTPATSTLTVRHLNRPGVLAHVFEILGNGDQNVEDMENVIYEGGDGAVARIQLGGTISEDDLDAIAAHEHVLAVSNTPINAGDEPGAVQ